MEKKKILILAIALVLCAGIITIGILSEKNGGVENNTDVATQVENQQSVEDDKTETTLPANTETAEPQILTVENCEDLANLLTDESSDVSKAFVEKYKNQIIELDSHIAEVNNHKNYDTRYDILMYAGDYNPESAQGPNFKFEDVNTNDLGIDDLYLPAFVNAGSNIHIVAEVKNYDDVAGVLNLDPISIQSR